MTVTVLIPSTLRAYLNDSTAELSIKAATVREALEELKRCHPPLYNSVCDETGSIRQHINLFVNDSLVIHRNESTTKLQPSDNLSIMPAVSGG